MVLVPTGVIGTAFPVDSGRFFKGPDATCDAVGNALLELYVAVGVVEGGDEFRGGGFLEVGTLACNLKLLLEAAVAACFEGRLPALELACLRVGMCVPSG